MSNTIDPRDTPEFALEYGQPKRPNDEAIAYVAERAWNTIWPNAPWTMADDEMHAKWIRYTRAVADHLRPLIEAFRSAEPEDALAEARSHAATALADYDALWEGDGPGHSSLKQARENITEAADELAGATRRLLEASATPLSLARKATRIKPGDYVAVIYPQGVHMSQAAHDNILERMEARWPGVRFAILSEGPRLEIMEPQPGDDFDRIVHDEI